MRTLLTLGLLAATGAATAGDLTPWLAVKGKVLLTEDFSGPTLPESWLSLKGNWTQVDGALKGVELAADKHAAVIRTNLGIVNAIVQFDFMFDGAGKAVHLSLNESKGHNSRVVITPTGFSVRKDGSKTDESDKPAVLGERNCDIKPGEWRTMIVEIVGDTICARIDDANYAFGSDRKVDRPRSNFGFPVTGDGVRLDNIKIWEATPNPEWTKKQATLASTKPAPKQTAKAAKTKKAATNN